MAFEERLTSKPLNTSSGEVFTAYTEQIEFRSDLCSPVVTKRRHIVSDTKELK